MNAPDTITLFLDNASKASAGTHRVKDRRELADKISELVSRDVKVFCPRATNIEKAAALSIPKLARDYETAQVTIEEVSAAIAETGSIVCQDTGKKAVQAGLHPSHHVALVPRENIFATLDDFFALYAASSPTNMKLITGPSRNTNIELNLFIGDGPARLDIIVV
jgi:L-lactate dehydrogenase complex protein LldG